MPGSALTPQGSTRAWRKLRALYAATLPQPCWRCGHPITPTQPWQLGHIVDRADGGDDTRLAPEHRSCGSSAGAAAQTRRARQAQQGWAPLIDEPTIHTRTGAAQLPPPRR